MNKRFHISKRTELPWYKSWAIRAIAILLALVTCAIITMLMTGENPISIYATIFYGAFGTARRSWVTVQDLAILLGISLGTLLFFFAAAGGHGQHQCQGKHRCKEALHSFHNISLLFCFSTFALPYLSSWEISFGPKSRQLFGF